MYYIEKCTMDFNLVTNATKKQRTSRMSSTSYGLFYSKAFCRRQRVLVGKREVSLRNGLKTKGKKVNIIINNLFLLINLATICGPTENWSPPCPFPPLKKLLKFEV